MASEHAWAAERQRFIAEHAAAEETSETAPGPGSGSGLHPPTVSEGPSLLGMEVTQVARQLCAAETTEAMMQRIVASARQFVPGAQLVSFTVRDEHEQLSTPVSTHELAARLDTLQHTHREGPGVSATGDGGSGQAASADLASDTQWPVWSPAAVADGVSSVLAAGVCPNGARSRSGSLTCYGTSAGPLDHDATGQDTMLLLAAHAGTVLSTRHALDASEHELAGLRQALHTHEVIGQATGMLMAGRGLGAEQAFDRLRQASHELNRTLAHLAVEPRH